MRAADSATNFWDLRHPPQATAVIDSAGGKQWSYGDLLADADRTAAQINQAVDENAVCLLLAQNRYECLVAYLATLRARRPLILADAGLNEELLSRLIDTYQPELICATRSARLLLPQYEELQSDIPSLWRRRSPEPQSRPHPELAMLLNTSGSTGSPKLVRLTYQALQANASAVAESLSLTSLDRPVTSLPMAYAYGLSVINSHLLVGATLTLTDLGVLQRPFWECISRHACNSLSGVPYTYQLLLQTGLLEKHGAQLRSLTQAGGRLADADVEKVQRISDRAGARFFVMYGQTEATARIACVPFDVLPQKIGSIGIAVPGGSMQLSPTGELLYTGPNVMMGYAETRADLCLGDQLNGVLRTGDLARSDDDGFYYVTGRLKRFLKLFGKRFNLDEIELLLQRGLECPVACFGRDDGLLIAIASHDVAGAATLVRRLFALPRDVFRILSVESLPRTINGKVNYHGLEEAAHA